MENKKNPQLDVRKKSGLFFNIGLAISLLFVLLAFEYKSHDDESWIEYENIDDIPDETIMPLTIQPPPPKPPKQIVKFEVVKEEDLIEDLMPNIDTESTEETVIPEPEDIYIKPEEVEETFIVVEHMPTYPAGLNAFYKFIGKKMKYPPRARSLGVQGKVIISFVINKEGKMTEIQILRGLGAGCDEEAIRVLKKVPHWNPGKQRGKAVKVQMVIPITFKLN